jgi:hypothetical protein
MMVPPNFLWVFKKKFYTLKFKVLQRQVQILN